MPEKPQMKIADIVFDFDNDKLISLLRKRGKAITSNNKDDLKMYD
jgi:hypothetical protein